MKRNYTKLTATAVALALSAGLAPSAFSAVSEEPNAIVAQAVEAEAPSQAERFAAAMQGGQEAATAGAEQIEDEPFAVPAAAAGLAVKEGAKWAGKQVAKGALKEAGTKLIGLWG